MIVILLYLREVILKIGSNGYFNEIREIGNER